MCGRFSDGSNIYELEHSTTEENQQMLTRIVQTFDVLLELSLDCIYRFYFHKSRLILASVSFVNSNTGPVVAPNFLLRYDSICTC